MVLYMEYLYIILIQTDRRLPLVVLYIRSSLWIVLAPKKQNFCEYIGAGLAR
jgi:hypothetical protein